MEAYPVVFYWPSRDADEGSARVVVTRCALTRLFPIKTLCSESGPSRESYQQNRQLADFDAVTNWMEVTTNCEATRCVCKMSVPKRLDRCGDALDVIRRGDFDRCVCKMSVPKRFGREGDKGDALDVIRRGGSIVAETASLCSSQ